MNDFQNFEKTIVRELSCRLCLCTDVVKLKPLSVEVKKKLKKLFDITIRSDDSLPKAICHDCLQQVGTMHLYAVKVEKTQKFLDFHKLKSAEEKHREHSILSPLIAPLTVSVPVTQAEGDKKPSLPKAKLSEEQQQGDAKPAKPQKQAPTLKKKPTELKFMEAMSLDEFAKTEKVDKSLLNGTTNKLPSTEVKDPESRSKKPKPDVTEVPGDGLDSIVLIDGRPAKHGAALDKQITMFYKMECCICHESGFHFRSLMKHYKDRHGVPGYVTCCDKKFHYFYPKKIIEHMAYHMQPNIFMCPSCHKNFQTSQELYEHQTNGGRSEGKILCPRCNERFPTYHELGMHIVSHRIDKTTCDYCGKQLKHHHRKKTVNHMDDVILCSQCLRTLRNIEKQEKDLKEKTKTKNSDDHSVQKYQKFRQAMELTGYDEEATSTD